MRLLRKGIPTFLVLQKLYKILFCIIRNCEYFTFNLLMKDVNVKYSFNIINPFYWIYKFEHKHIFWSYIPTWKSFQRLLLFCVFVSFQYQQVPKNWKFVVYFCQLFCNFFFSMNKIPTYICRYTYKNQNTFLFS